MRPRAALAAFVAVAWLPLAGHAAEAVATEQDPVTSARAVALESKLRCLVCQNESIAESHASLAADLRGQVRQQIAAGRSDDEIIAFMVARYGDFVLYDPPLKPTTLLLWIAPALLLVASVAGLARHVRRQGATTPSSDEARERGARLLAQAAKEPT